MNTASNTPEDRITPAPGIETRPAVDLAKGEADEFALGWGFDFGNLKSPLARFYLNWSHVAAIVFLAFVFLWMSYIKLWHTDIWGHLRFGEYIVQEHQLPTREMFSGDYADQNALYINYQWLAQAGGYLLFDLGRHLAPPDADHQLGGGVVMLCLGHALIVVARLVVLLFAFRRLTGSMRASVFGMIVVFSMAAVTHLFILRPQVLGELGFALLLFALSKPLLSRRALVLIPLLMVLWANTHGSFLMGLVLLGLFLCGQTLDVLRINSWRVGSVAGDAQWQRLALVLILSFTAVAALNPHGPSLYWHAWQLANHPNIQFLEEWKRLPWTSIPGYIFVASVIALVPLLMWSPRRWTAVQLLLLLAFGIQTVLHARVFIWWSVIWPWVMLPHLAALFQRIHLPMFEETDRPDLRRTILAVMAAVVIVLWSAPLQWLFWGDAPSGKRRLNDMTPVKASARLKAIFTADPSLPRCVFTSETLGEYLLWDLRLDPPVRIFAYTHVHLLTTQHWLEFMHVKNGDPGWQEILDRHGVAFILVEPELHQQLTKEVGADKNWEEIPVGGPQMLARRRYSSAAER